MPECPKCDKVVKNAHALKIHMGRMHKTGVQRKAARRSLGTGRNSSMSNDLTSVSTSSLMAEIRRRADAYDRLKALSL